MVDADNQEDTDGQAALHGIVQYITADFRCIREKGRDLHIG